MRLAGHRGERFGDLVERRPDIGKGRTGIACTAIVMTSESSCNRVPVMAFDPCESGVTKPVGSDLLSRCPR